MKLTDHINKTPRPFDEEAGARLLAGLPDDLLAGAGDDVRALIKAVGGCSPFLARLMMRDPDALRLVLDAPLDAVIDGAIVDARSAPHAGETEAQMRLLRKARARVALAAALAEISGAWTALHAAERLADFADAAACGALLCALQGLTRKGFTPVDVADPLRDCGIAVIAMGKMGGRELNYSSDIDVIVLFDPDAPALGEGAREIAVSAAKQIVRLLQDQTPDGYVFRTDLRLRPDPGVSAAAVSVSAAEAYYEAHGQNWERAAFIRARAAAGDIALGERFLKALRPFVWRKYLDFAAIEDIRSISRQIHAAKGGARIEFYGHDVKTGRGGIREIEFLAQTFQLILGGKDVSLRPSNTIAALNALAAQGAIDVDKAGDLCADYEYLRHVEHRIQMVNDEQTHKIPAQEEAAERLAAFLGEADAAAFEARLRGVLARVHDYFAELFEQEERLSAESGNLSFTGVEPDPETLKSLEAMGFSRGRDIWAAVSSWHAGGVRAARTARARQLLTRLTPALLESLSRASDPDDAFIAFDKFLGQLPSGVQIFSLFANSPEIFDRLTEIMSIAPYLGRALARRRNLIEALLEGLWPPPLPDREGLAENLSARLARAGDFEEALNIVRRFTGEEQFQIAAQLVTGHVAPTAARASFSDVADATIAALLPAVRAEMARAHGEIDGELVIVGLGRLGARQMTMTSDIDLIFVYDAPEGAVSDGARPLDAVSYFTRLVRRWLTALSAQTEEGRLYEVDMQLRPSGRAGPAAVSKAAFVKYYAEDAWTWERMALTKARAIAGGPTLSSFLEAEFSRIIAQSKGAPSLLDDVDAMRMRLAEAKPGASIWDVKHNRGGLTDLDFMGQAIQLNEGRVLSFERCAELIAARVQDVSEKELLTAAELFETIVQVSRAAIGGVFAPAEAGAALKARMAAACGVADLGEAEKVIARTQTMIAGAYDQLIKNPAQPLAADGAGPVADYASQNDPAVRSQVEDASEDEKDQDQ